jgi:transposase-like protein
MRFRGGRRGKTIHGELKFQIVLELLSGEITAAQAAKAYGIHPNTASAWRNAFLKKWATELDTEALVDVIRRRSDSKERRQALAALEKRGMVDSL